MTDQTNALSNTPASAETLNRLKEQGASDQPRQPVGTSFGHRDRNAEPVAKVPGQLAGK
jgi:hypothetical protein